VAGFQEADLPLLALVDLVDAAPATQALVPEHLAYADDAKLIPSERHTCIRNLIPAALAEFRRRVAGSQ
jgi:hypothetical protein